MPESSRQKRVTGRVMHEFAHGELKSGPGGKAGTVKSRKQAIAIALSEAGAARGRSPQRNARNRKRSEGFTRRELYARAQAKRIAGRSRMSKQQLQTALGLG